MNTEDLIRTATTHYLDPETPEEWAISVASLPDSGHVEIVEKSPQIRHSIYKVARAADLFDAGFPAFADDPPHALVMLEEVPAEETCVVLRTLFTDEYENPFYEERKLRRGRR